VALAAVGLSACGPTPQPDDAAIVRDYQQHRSQVEVTADGTVVHVLSDSNGPSGSHERFVLRLKTADLTLLIDHNLSIGKRVPVRPGDRVLVHGEYVWNAQGGLIHFTHHDPAGTHEGGFIQDGGQVYD
jgi:hypothetical protein